MQSSKSVPAATDPSSAGSSPRNSRPTARRALVALLCVAAILALAALLSGCGDRYADQRGKGDAPVGATDDGAAQVINMPDKFPNIAHKCDGHGHRIYVTSGQGTSHPGEITVIADPSCGGGG